MSTRSITHFFFPLRATRVGVVCVGGGCECANVCERVCVPASLPYSLHTHTHTHTHTHARAHTQYVRGCELVNHSAWVYAYGRFCGAGVARARRVSFVSRRLAVRTAFMSCSSASLSSSADILRIFPYDPRRAHMRGGGRRQSARNAPQSACMISVQVRK